MKKLFSFGFLLIYSRCGRGSVLCWTLSSQLLTLANTNTIGNSEMEIGNGKWK